MNNGNVYNSYGTSWADQWDNGPDPIMAGSKNKNSTTKYKEKVGEGLGKTKVVASSGMKKIKDGTSVGLNWIKTKYSKATNKH
ncbi:hypothetical protein RYX36_026432 [Vicia faba]